MASTTEFTASCALCRRHLLVGEPARLYQDPSSKRFAKVCPLCYERAERSGWRADGRPIVAVHANPPADQALRERESLIDRLRGQHAYKRNAHGVDDIRRNQPHQHSLPFDR